MARNGSYTFLVSKKEFIICCADFAETPIITGSSMRRASSSIFVTLRKPSPAPPLNTLLILQKETPSHFLVNSHNWLELQQVIQKLFSSRTLSLDLYKEALAQKLTRVPSSSPPSLDLRAGRRSGSAVLQRLSPETGGRHILAMVAIRRGFLDHHSQWTFNPNLILEALLQSICTHLKKEPSSFIFQKPVDNVAFPNYRRVIAQPMDLSTLSRRVDSNYYTTYTAFHNDIIRLFRNGCTFNACCDIWYQQCVVLKLVYMHIYSDLLHSGLLNSLQSQIPHSQVISVRRDGRGVHREFERVAARDGGKRRNGCILGEILE